MSGKVKNKRYNREWLLSSGMWCLVVQWMGSCCVCQRYLLYFRSCIKWPMVPVFVPVSSDLWYLFSFLYQVTYGTWWWNESLLHSFTAGNQEGTATEYGTFNLLPFDVCLGAARGGKHLPAILFTWRPGGAMPRVCNETRTYYGLHETSSP